MRKNLKKCINYTIYIQLLKEIIQLSSSPPLRVKPRSTHLNNANPSSPCDNTFRTSATPIVRHQHLHHTHYQDWTDAWCNASLNPTLNFLINMCTYVLIRVCGNLIYGIFNGGVLTLKRAVIDLELTKISMKKL